MVADTHRHANTEMEIECNALDEQEEPSDMEEGKPKGMPVVRAIYFYKKGANARPKLHHLLQDGNFSRRAVLAQSSPPRQNDEVVEAEKYVYSTYVVAINSLMPKSQS
jgi:hypothetical protein